MLYPRWRPQGWWLFALLVAAWTGCGTSEPVTFSNVRIEEVGPYRALIRFETSRPTRCHLEFGLAPDVLDGRATDPDMEAGTYVIQHKVPLEDLTPDTVYYFTAVATDSDGIDYHSAMGEVMTGPPVAVDSLMNVALSDNGTTVAGVSSNFADAGVTSPYGANKAIDGRMNTEWSTDYDGNDAFLELDLGKPRDIRFIGFRSREMTDGTSIIRSFTLDVDGEITLGPYETPDPSVRYVIELPARVTTRYVRMNAIDTSGGNTGLRELQLFVP
jgi:hypothetical protein